MGGSTNDYELIFKERGEAQRARGLYALRTGCNLKYVRLEGRHLTIRRVGEREEGILEAILAHNHSNPSKRNL